MRTGALRDTEKEQYSLNDSSVVLLLLFRHEKTGTTALAAVAYSAHRRFLSRRLTSYSSFHSGVTFTPSLRRI